MATSTTKKKSTFSPGCLSVVLAWAGVGFGYFGGKLVVDGIKEGSGPGVGWLVLATAVLCFLGFARAAYHSEQVGKQKARNEVAEQELQAIRSSRMVVPDRAFRLLLRPFGSVGRVLVKNPFASTADAVDAFLGFDRVDFEVVLAALFEANAMKLIAIGGERDPIGAGRLHLPSPEWKRSFLELSRAAEALYVIPGASPGSMWEVESLKARFLLEKVIFIMPPGASEVGERSAEWEALSRTMLRIGLRVPRYQRTGLVFKLEGVSGSVVKRRVLEPFKQEVLLEIVNEFEGPN